MISRDNSRVKGAIICLFFAILWAPLLQMATGYPKILLLDENRNRERSPKYEELRHPGLFVLQAQKWFDDHYGYRDWLIRAKTQIDYSVFGVSDRVYIGKEGWLYLRSIIDKEEPAIEAMSDGELDAVVRRFAALRDFLATKNVRLVVITNQLKDKFYPEYLPYTVRRKNDHQRFDDFRERLRTLPGIVYIDSTEILSELKKQRQVFYKTDLHWNDPAATEVARTLVDRIAALEGRELPFWRFPLNIQVEETTGGEARFMPLFRPPKEEALIISPNPAVGSFRFVDEGPFREATQSNFQDDAVLPAIVLSGDSFSDGMIRSGLNAYFKVLYHMKGTPQDLPALLPADARYFVYQFIQSRLPRNIVTELGIPLGEESL